MDVTVTTEAGYAGPIARRPAPAFPLLAAIGAPAAVVAAAVVVTGGRSLGAVPVQHFWVVSLVAAIAFGVALALAIATVRLAVYRVLFLALGFMSMAGLFAVHGLATPGVLITDPEYLRDAGNVVGASAFLSLLIPSGLFAASYTSVGGRLQRRLPFAPAGWLVVLVAAAVAGYAAVAIGSTELLGNLPLGRRPYSVATAAVTIGLLVYSGLRQAQVWRRSGDRFSASLLVAFALLGEAQLMMLLMPVWSAGWWSYHLLMLAAVCLALRGLAVERARGRSIRETVEQALQLEVGVDRELAASDTLSVLSAAIELRDHETEGHNQRVARLSVAIGRELGLTHEGTRVLARGGLLHDVGKLAVPDAILRKPGPLDDDEWREMRRHPELGVQILQRIGSLRREAQIVLAHHERVDGRGYPRGLVGGAIPLEARIVAVADTYDALTSDRPYRRALSATAARRIVVEESGTHLDPDAVDALVRLIDRGATL